MSVRAKSGPDREETVTGRPTVHQLLVAVAVLAGAALASLLAGAGFGLLVVTLALLASGVWMAYGAAPSTSPAPPATRVRNETTDPPANGIVAMPRVPTFRVPSVSIDRQSIVSLSFLSKLGAITTIVAVGAFAFLRDRDINPPGFFADEAEIGVQSWKLLHWQADTTSIPFFYHHLEYEHLGTLTLFATAPFVAIFGLTEHAVRGSSAFWTIMAAIVIYLTLRRLAVPYAVVPVIATLLSPLVILVTRTNFGHAPSLFAMSAGFLLWVVARQQGRILVAFGGGLLIGLSAYGQSSYYVAVPLLLMAILLTEIAYNQRDRNAYRTVAWMVLGAILILLPVPYRALTYDPFLDRYRDKTGGALHGWDRVSSWIHMYPDYFSFDMLFVHGTTGWQTRHTIVGAPWFFRSMLVFLFVGLVSLVAVRGDRVKRFIWPMALVLLLYPIPDIISRHAGDGPYSFSLIWGSIGIPFVVGYGFIGIGKLASRVSISRPALLYATAITAVSLFGFAEFWRGAFADYPNTAADYWGWQYGAKPIADYFESHAADYDEFVMSGDFNAAYILEEFYMNGSDIAPVTHTGGLDALDLSKRQIFAMRTSEWERDRGSQYPARSYLEIIGTIDYPNGMPAFYLLTADPELLTPGSGQTTAPAG